MFILVAAGGCLNGAYHAMASLDPAVLNGVSVTAAKWDSHEGCDYVELKVENYSKNDVLIGGSEVVWTDANGVEKSANCCANADQLSLTDREAIKPVQIPSGSSGTVLVPVPFHEAGQLLLEVGPAIQWVQQEGQTPPFRQSLLVPLDRPEKITAPVWKKLRNLHFGISINSDGF